MYTGCYGLHLFVDLFVLALQVGNIDGHKGFIFNEKMANFPIDCLTDYRTSPIVFILGKNVDKYEDMPYG
jgi:hypothetical protein